MRADPLKKKGADATIATAMPAAGADDGARPPPAKRPRRSSPPPPVVVVDGHHDALEPLWRAAAGGRPATLVHFDSHPDLAPLPAGTPRSLLTALARGRAAAPPPGLRARLDIASWILPLVLGGCVDAVVWVAGPWCAQMDPGVYALRVGLAGGAGRTPRLAVASAAPPGDAAAAAAAESGCGLYWRAAGAWVPAARLRPGTARDWTLRCVRLRPRGALRCPPADAAAIAAAARAGPWLLDVDEDFFTVQNPFRAEFEAFFGAAAFAALRAAYAPRADAAAEWAALRAAVCGRGGARAPPAVRRLLRAMRAAGVAADLFPPAALHLAGETAGLPHHATRAADVVRALDGLSALLAALPAPAAVTVATSRTDGYLPESQSRRVHRAVMARLLARYRGARVERRDRPALSVPP